MELLSSNDFDEPYKAIELIKNQKIENEIIDAIFSLEDNLVIAEFLNKVNVLTNQQIDDIIKRIDIFFANQDRLFV